jgi:hypothetical protein
VEELEHEADAGAAQHRQPIFVERRDLGAADVDRAAARRVEAGHQAEQRGLAAPGRSDDGEELAVGHGEIEGMENGQRTVAALDRFRDAAQGDHRVGVASRSRTTGSSTRQTVPATRRAPA